MKITIYKLLGMIKDGKAPKKIKVTGTIYYFDEEFNFYFTKTTEGVVALGGKLNEINLLYNFNNENNVEIIEEHEEEPQEHKIPDKIEMVGCNMKVNILDKETLLPTENMQTEFLIKKINEILDYLEKIE